LIIAPDCIARAQAVRDITDAEIIIGTNADLSGVGAPSGANNSDAIRMVFDDANAKAGVHDRKIRYRLRRLSSRESGLGPESGQP